MLRITIIINLLMQCHVSIFNLPLVSVGQYLLTKGWMITHLSIYLKKRGRGGGGGWKAGAGRSLQLFIPGEICIITATMWHKAEKFYSGTATTSSMTLTSWLTSTLSLIFCWNQSRIKTVVCYSLLLHRKSQTFFSLLFNPFIEKESVVGLIKMGHVVFGISANSKKKTNLCQDGLHK